MAHSPIPEEVWNEVAAVYPAGGVRAAQRVLAAHGYANVIRPNSITKRMNAYGYRKAAEEGAPGPARASDPLRGDFWDEEEGDLPFSVRRRCMNRDCIERFTPVNDGHWYHHPDCRQSDRLWTKEEILAEEGSLYPEASGTEMAARAFGQKNRLQRRVQQLTSQREFFKYHVSKVLTENPWLRFPPMAPSVRVAPDGTRTPREIILIVSDWQIGKMENGIGVQTFIESRFPRIVEATIAIIQRVRASGHPVERVHLVPDGDMIEGCFIYAGQNVTGLDRQHNSHRLIKQIHVTAQLLAKLAQELSAHVAEVVVHSVPGNHGRTNGKNDFSDPEDNFDTLVAYWARDICQSIPNVVWDINEGWFGRFNVFDHQVVAQHGDAWNGPVTKLEALLPQWVTGNVFGVRPDLLISAHRHSFCTFEVNGIQVVQNGTADGGSLWYTRAYGRSSRPIQTVIVSSPDRVVEDLCPIFLDENER